MRLARLRRFASMLVLVLTAGLAAPALASSDPVRPAAHVHADGVVHVHGSDAAVEGTAATPATAKHRCLGCTTAADCAVACVGVGVLPAAVSVPARRVALAWPASILPQPAGLPPAGTIDPPRPVSLR